MKLHLSKTTCSAVIVGCLFLISVTASFFWQPHQNAVDSANQLVRLQVLPQWPQPSLACPGTHRVDAVRRNDRHKFNQPNLFTYQAQTRIENSENSTSRRGNPKTKSFNNLKLAFFIPGPGEAEFPERRATVPWLEKTKEPTIILTAGLAESNFPTLRQSNVERTLVGTEQVVPTVESGQQSPNVISHVPASNDITPTEDRSVANSKSQQGPKLEPALRLNTPSNSDYSDPAPFPPVEDRQLSSNNPPGKNLPSKSHQAWTVGDKVINQLQEMTQTAVCRNWAEATLTQLNVITKADSLTAKDAGIAIGILEKLNQQTREIATQCGDDRKLQVHFLHVAYGIDRRTKLWQTVHLTAQEQQASTSSINKTTTMIQQLEAVAAKLGDQPNDEWQTFLRLNELQKMASVASRQNIPDRSKLARDVLGRLHSSQLTSEQRKYLQRPLWQELSTQLRQWAAVPLQLESLLVDIETFEQHPSNKNVERVATHLEVLRWSEIQSAQNLKRTLDVHWRNANICATANSDLLNRLLPTVQSQQDRIRDAIDGVQVVGRTDTSTNLFLHLLPDDRKIRMSLEAHGRVSSNTVSHKGPVHVRNKGLTQYEVKKLIVVSHDGIQQQRATATAQLSSDLVGLETQFDSIPLIGSVARSIARSQVGHRQGMANRKVERKVSQQASERLDKKVQQKIHEVESKFTADVLLPLRALKLQPTVIDLRTTNEYVRARYRVAATEQLAAYTPRPRAPQDSLMNIQIHQSALNNTIDQLDLAGRELSLHELHTKFTQQLAINSGHLVENLPGGISIRFAKSEPIRIHYQNGCFEVVLKIAKLVKANSRRWRNFTVRGIYEKDPNDLRGRFYREQGIQLEGHRLQYRLALRVIFSKVMSRNRAFYLIPESFAQNPQFQDLQVTQFVVKNGWIGFAWGKTSPLYTMNLEPSDPSTGTERPTQSDPGIDLPGTSADS